MERKSGSTARARQHGEEGVSVTGEGIMIDSRWDGRGDLRTRHSFCGEDSVAHLFVTFEILELFTDVGVAVIEPENAFSASAPGLGMHG